VTTLDVGGRAVKVSTLDRVLFPGCGWTKADVLDYYLAVAEALLPHVAGHPMTLHRYPDGVLGTHFFQTRTPPHPEWLRTVTLHYPRTGKTFQTPVVDDLAALVWAVNLSAIELHPFLSPAAAFDRPRWLVVDLDPGPPATIADAADVAVVARDHLVAAGLPPAVKTSGGKGLHLFSVLPPTTTYDDSKGLARMLADGLAEALPQLVVTTMTRARRPGRVLVDWSQNDPGKSTVAPYSLRGLARPSVSTPLTWAEVEALTRTRDPATMAFSPPDVVARLDRHGDLFAGVLRR
jgi:bifunctional non-homologous end joining protein LigD